MLEISHFNRKFEIREEGEQIFKARSMTSLAKFLNQERPDAVESHIHHQNSISFNISSFDQEALEKMLLSGFREEHYLDYDLDYDD